MVTEYIDSDLSDVRYSAQQEQLRKRRRQQEIIDSEKKSMRVRYNTIKFMTSCAVHGGLALLTAGNSLAVTIPCAIMSFFAQTSGRMSEDGYSLLSDGVVDKLYKDPKSKSKLLHQAVKDSLTGTLLRPIAYVGLIAGAVSDMIGYAVKPFHAFGAQVVGASDIRIHDIKNGSGRDWIAYYSLKDCFTQARVISPGAHSRKNIKENSVWKHKSPTMKN